MDPNAPISLTNADLFAGVAGFLLPLVIGSIANSEWDRRLQAVTAFVAVLIVATGTVFFSGQLNTTDWIRTALIVLTTTITSYQGVMKPMGIDSWLKNNFLNTPKAKVQLDSVNRVSPTELTAPKPSGERHYVETDAGEIIEVERHKKE
jgi:hypothetical protein